MWKSLRNTSTTDPYPYQCHAFDFVFLNIGPFFNKSLLRSRASSVLSGRSDAESEVSTSLPLRQVVHGKGTGVEVRNPMLVAPDRPARTHQRE